MLGKQKVQSDGIKRMIKQGEETPTSSVCTNAYNLVKWEGATEALPMVTKP